MIIQWRNFFKNKDLNLQYNPTTVKRWAWRRKNWACPLLLSYEKVEISSIRSMMHNCYGRLVQELYRNRDYSKHLCLPPLLPRRLGFMGTVCFGEWHPKHPHGSPGKAVKIFLIWSPLDFWKMDFQSKKHWKYILLCLDKNYNNFQIMRFNHTMIFFKLID